MATLRELLERRCDVAGGTQVTNCVLHIHLKLTERPDDCKLCTIDVSNRLRQCIRVNEWLNEWKDDATEFLRRANAQNPQPENESRKEPQQKEKEKL